MAIYTDVLLLYFSDWTIPIFSYFDILKSSCFCNWHPGASVGGMQLPVSGWLAKPGQSHQELHFMWFCVCWWYMCWILLPPKMSLKRLYYDSTLQTKSLCRQEWHGSNSTDISEADTSGFAGASLVTTDRGIRKLCTIKTSRVLFFFLMWYIKQWWEFMAP